MQNWNELIFSEAYPFSEKAEKVFEYQCEKNEVYRRYCKALGMAPESATHHSEIGHRTPTDDLLSFPLLPIQAFKDTTVTCKAERKPDLIFQSSGTSGMEKSRHLVADPELYRQSLLRGFRHFYDLGKAIIWGYTPGYGENPHSSLIWMINELIKQDGTGLSRFLPLGEPLNKENIERVRQTGKQLIVFGAAFGLLDLVNMKSPELPGNSIAIETGGMKTHRREISRNVLHRKLAKGFGLHQNRIHSEYGMAELLSQAYTTGGEWFSTVPWMQVSIRNPDNAKEEQPAYQEGLIGVVDLANVHSCSFILTGDKGIKDQNNRFKVLGRWHPKDVRGCNFLIEED